MKSKTISTIPLTIILLLFAALAFSLASPTYALSGATGAVVMSRGGNEENQEWIHISGQVLYTRGTPAPGLRVRLLLDENQIADQVRTGPDGRFHFGRHETESYQIHIFSGNGRPLPWEDDQIFHVSPEENRRTVEHTIRLANYEVTGEVAPGRREDLAARSVLPLKSEMIRNRPSSPQDNAQISGIITAEESGEPLEDVSVDLFDDQGLAAFDYTGADGTYNLSLLAPGNYTLRFEPSVYGVSKAYQLEYFDDKPDRESATVITLAAGESFVADAALARSGGAIAGTVTGDGAALKDVIVTVYDADGDEVDSAESDENGEYIVAPLDPGVYRLGFEPHPYGDAVGFAPEFYDDQPDLASADPITINANETVTANAELSRGGGITGKVTAEVSGAPMENVYVRVYDSHGESVDSDWTDESGAYTLTGLPTGDYRLKFDPPYTGPSAEYLPEYHADKQSLSTADEISITAPEVIENLDAQLRRGGRISGQVTAAAGQPLPDIHISAYTLRGQLSESTTTDVSGAYTVTGLTDGIYWLFARPATDGVSLAYLPGHHLDPIPVTAPEEVGNLDFTLEPGGQISGRVTAAGSNIGLEDVEVYIYDGEERYLVQSVETDATGVYTTAGLAMGSYKLYFEPDNYGDSTHYLAAYYGGAPNLPSSPSVQINVLTLVSGIDAELFVGGQITGTVHAQDTGLPLDDVWVRAYDVDDDYDEYVWTDGDGAYQIEGLETGSYRIEFSPSNSRSHTPAGGYQPTFYDNQAELHDADPVLVTAPNVVTDINAVVARGGQITGTVTAADSGLSLEDVWVTLYDNEGVYLDGMRTDDGQGGFAFRGLSGGDYRLEYEPPDDIDKAAALYLPTFSGDKPDLKSAAPVHVTVGDTAVASQTLTRGGRIGGQIVREGTGKPLSNVDIKVYAADSGEKVGWAETDENGTYLTTGLATGVYWLEIEWDDYLLGPIEVSAPEVVEGVDGSRPQFTSHDGLIAGRVLGADSSLPLAGVRVKLAGCPRYGTDWTNHLGVYYFGGLPDGDYGLSAEPGSQTPSAPYRLTPARSIQLAEDEQIIDRLSMARGGRIAGLVRAEDTGLPLVDVEMDIYDADGEEIDEVETDAAGGYKTVGLPDGDYRLRFRADRDSGYLTEYSGNQPTLEAAQPIGVSGVGVVATHDADLAPGGRISGRVTAADTGWPMADVDVDVYASNGDWITSTGTDSHGRYITRVLPAGRYRVRFEMDHYFSVAPYMRTYFDGQPTWATAQEVEVIASQQTTGIDAVMEIGGQIAGVVTAEGSGQPLDNVWVSVYDEAGVRVALINTNRAGVYRTNGLRPGTYRLYFEPVDYSCDPEVLYFAEYYTDQATLNAATPVVITGTEVVDRIDAALSGIHKPSEGWKNVHLPLVRR